MLPELDDEELVLLDVEDDEELEEDELDEDDDELDPPVLVEVDPPDVEVEPPDVVVETTMLQNKNAETVYRACCDLWLDRYGIPDLIRTDNGNEFSGLG